MSLGTHQNVEKHDIYISSNSNPTSCLSLFSCSLPPVFSGEVLSSSRVGSSWTADSPALLSFFSSLHYSNKCVAFFLRHEAAQEPWPQRGPTSAHTTETHLHTKPCITYVECRRIELGWIENGTMQNGQFRGEIMLNHKHWEEQQSCCCCYWAHLDDTLLFICTLTVHLLLCLSLCLFVCFLSDQNEKKKKDIVKHYRITDSNEAVILYGLIIHLCNMHISYFNCIT